MSSELTSELELSLKSISTALTKGDYSKRMKINTTDSTIIRLQSDLNQILELVQLNLDMSLMGDDSIINKFIDIFSAFANRDFTKKLEICEEGTILDAIGAGINMLGQELEYSTVSKNELKAERNRLYQTQEIAKLCDWEFYHIEKRFICSATFYSILEIIPDDYNGIFNQFIKKLPNTDLELLDRTISELKTTGYYTFENKIIANNGLDKHLFHIINHIYDENNNHIGFKGIVQDISILKESQIKLKYQTELEKLIAELSSKFINHKGDDINVEINNALRECNLFFKVDRSYYLKFKGNNHTDIEIFEWNNEHVIYNTAELLSNAYQLFDICVSTAMNNEVIQFNNLEIEKTEIEQENELLSKFGVKSFICIPVYGNSEEFAIFGMDSVVNTRTWSNEEINGLKIISNIISDVINRDCFEKDLIIAREKAEESDRLKSAFLANMSHEIRTPMNGILGFAELLKIPNLSGEKQKEFINIIGKSGERMLNTIDDLINISKLEAGQMTIQKSDTDINEALDFLYNFFKPETEKNNIQFSVKYPSDDYHNIIETDKEKLYAILTNLIKNAIKFTKKGSIEFGLIVNQNLYEFYVRDTGIGIPINKQQVIFDRFVQADLRLVRGHEGSGLGLSISKAYVEMLGGKLWLESEPDTGSCFRFTIETNSTNYGEDVIKDFYIDKNRNEMINTTILVAEDDEDSMLFISHILKNSFRNYLTAKTGIEAIEIYKANPEIKIILMDINMPEMDGHTAAKLLKQLNPDLIIIAQTAFALDIEREKYSDVFNEYITKPVRIKHLIEIVQKFLK
jgi:signal transduction histidine kinase/CheY-like chemotaxis protein